MKVSTAKQVQCFTEIYPELVLGEVPVHKTYSRRQLGTLAPETRQEGVLWTLSAPATSLATRQTVLGDRCFEQYANSSQRYRYVPGKWRVCHPSKTIGVGSRVHLIDCYNFGRVAAEMFPDLKWELSQPLSECGRADRALRESVLTIVEESRTTLVFSLGDRTFTIRKDFGRVEMNIAHA